MTTKSELLLPSFGEALVKRMENDLLEETQVVMLGASLFADAPPAPGAGQPDEPPEDWIERWGEIRAKRMLKLARLALLPSSEAPIGFRLAQTTLVGITKARATVKGADRKFNVVMVELPAQSIPNYPVLPAENE